MTWSSVGSAGGRAPPPPSRLSGVREPLHVFLPSFRGFSFIFYFFGENAAAPDGRSSGREGVGDDSTG